VHEWDTNYGVRLPNCKKDERKKKVQFSQKCSTYKYLYESNPCRTKIYLCSMWKRDNQSIFKDDLQNSKKCPTSPKWRPKNALLLSLNPRYLRYYYTYFQNSVETWLRKLMRTNNGSTHYSLICLDKPLSSAETARATKLKFPAKKFVSP